ncbi:MAG: hypothetical protein AB2705_21140, partial [Candidatus Thiodiazotropha sp.]
MTDHLPPQTTSAAPETKQSFLEEMAQSYPSTTRRTTWTPSPFFFFFFYISLVVLTNREILFGEHNIKNPKKKITKIPKSTRRPTRVDAP